MDPGLFLDFLVHCFISLFVQEPPVLITAALEYGSVSVPVSCTYYYFPGFSWLFFWLCFFFFNVNFRITLSS